MIEIVIDIDGVGCRVRCGGDAEASADPGFPLEVMAEAIALAAGAQQLGAPRAETGAETRRETKTPCQACGGAGVIGTRADGETIGCPQCG